MVSKKRGKADSSSGKPRSKAKAKAALTCGSWSQFTTEPADGDSGSNGQTHQGHGGTYPEPPLVTLFSNFGHWCARGSQE